MNFKVVGGREFGRRVQKVEEGGGSTNIVGMMEGGLQPNLPREIDLFFHLLMRMWTTMFVTLCSWILISFGFSPGGL